MAQSSLGEIPFVKASGAPVYEPLSFGTLTNLELEVEIGEWPTAEFAEPLLHRLAIGAGVRVASLLKRFMLLN